MVTMSGRSSFGTTSGVGVESADESERASSAATPCGEERSKSNGDVIVDRVPEETVQLEDDDVVEQLDEHVDDEAVDCAEQVDDEEGVRLSSSMPYELLRRPNPRDLARMPWPPPPPPPLLVPSADMEAM